MYADREEGVNRTSIRQRLDRISGGTDRRRPVTGKRQRQDDDKWEHDMYKNNESIAEARKVDVSDLRLKLLKKSVQQATRNGNGSTSGVRDLREKLSGTMYSDNMDASQPKPVSQSNKTSRKNVIVEVPEPETKNVATVTRKKTQQKADSLDGFLDSLGLEKYLITFQAEEVDMATLVLMTEEDLKALGIPMGPRKKILIALESRT